MKRWTVSLQSSAEVAAETVDTTLTLEQRVLRYCMVDSAALQRSPTIQLGDTSKNTDSIPALAIALALDVLLDKW